jgi:hypothetical protein
MRLSIALTLLTTRLAFASTAPDLWEVGALDPGAAPAKLMALDQAAPALPAAVRPALAFQKMWIQIRAGLSEEIWRPELERMAKLAGEDPCTVGLRELARAWISRLFMRQIDTALLKYYRRQVRFPDSLNDVLGDIPKAAQLDAWGAPWVYKPVAPSQLKLAKQRYDLGTARYPLLSSFKDALKSSPTVPAWKIAIRMVGSSRVLELQSANGKTAALQEGGRLGEIGLLFIGDGWALFADTEHLFTAAF